MRNKFMFGWLVLAALILVGVGCGAADDGGRQAAKRAPDGTGSPLVDVRPDDNGGQLLGGDRDEHGCIGSAGYSWCEGKQKCLRVWEEACEGDSGSATCALENCHGLDIKCGPNPPDVCTEMYGVGDRCLKYAKCGVQDGQCQQLPDPQFTRCQSCVQACVDANKDDTVKLFECEGGCN